MAEDFITEGMLETFLFENEQLLEKLEEIVLENQDTGGFDNNAINEIFRIMHTIKGSSGIMMYNNITTITHKLEDVFYYLRESHPENINHGGLVEYVLAVSDFVNAELQKIRNGQESDGDSSELIAQVQQFLEETKVSNGDAEPPVTDTMIKSSKRKKPSASDKKTEHHEKQSYYIAPVASENSRFYHIVISYKSDTDMSNIRAYTAVFSLKEIAEDLLYTPEDIITNEKSHEVIMKEGFRIALQTQSNEEDIMQLIDHSSGVESIQIEDCTADEFLNGFEPEEEDEEEETEDTEEIVDVEKGIVKIKEEPENYVIDRQAKAVKKAPAKSTQKSMASSQTVQAFISVNVKKMDMLMDLIGELVIAEAVVLQNPDLKVPGLDLTNFSKAASQMSKITGELQEGIMSIRMMPLTNTFQKMKRIVYDVSKSLGKDIELELIGEETEVDKNIIEHISDPIMHLIRNSVDHGIESNEVRKAAGKSVGTITLEAKNEGDKVCISVKDDGKGLSKEKLLEKARNNGLLTKDEKDYTDKEIYNLITLPGFSTKEQVTEYSGRGVGMDVVVKNIQSVRGSLDIESKEGYGSTMMLKIPLTLAIIDGIVLRVGNTTFITATNSIKEFLRVEESQMYHEPDGGEFIMIRGECYPVIRLKEHFHMNSGLEDVTEGIMAFMIHEESAACVFADELVGEQEIVIKAMPAYMKKVNGISGCAQLGDGSIGLILDAGKLIKKE